MGASPMHSKNFIPFSLSKFSKRAYSFKKTCSCSDNFIDFFGLGEDVFYYVLSSCFPRALLLFLNADSGIFSSCAP
jgi:hypothetical protein